MVPIQPNMESLRQGLEIVSSELRRFETIPAIADGRAIRAEIQHLHNAVDEVTAELHRLQETVNAQ